MNNNANRALRASRKARIRGLGMVLLLGFILLGLSWAACPRGYRAQELEKKSEQPVKVKSAERKPVEIKLQQAPNPQNPEPKAPPEGPHPVVKVIGEPTFDFGNFWVGEPVEHTFKLKNEGDAVLLIQSVKPG